MDEPVDCVGGENCISGAGKLNPCPDPCTRCESANECTHCQRGYFLYHTPNITSDGVKIISCVKCPFFDAALTFSTVDRAVKCPECVENSDQWEFTRQCFTSLYYKKPVSPRLTGTFRIYDDGQNHHSFYLKWNSATSKFETQEIEKCLIMQSSDYIRYVDEGYWEYNNGEIADVEPVLKPVEQEADYTTLKFENRINFQNTDNFDSIFDETPDLGTLQEFNLCTKCAIGYIIDQVTLNCVPCPANCLLCGYKPNGDKYCQDCDDGYALNHQLNCVACMTGCSSCYFGNSVYNISDLVVQEYEQVIFKENIVNVDGHFTTQFFTKPNGGGSDPSEILCFQCLNKEKNEYYIPSIDLKTCLKCSGQAGISNKCLRCDFYNKNAQELRIMGNLHPPIPTADQSKWELRCLICQDNYFFDIDGKNCILCDIADCLKCYKGKNANTAERKVTYTFKDLIHDDPIVLFPSLSPDVNYKKLCVQCANGKILTENRETCDPIVANSNPPAANTIANCQSYVYDYTLATPVPACVKCDANYVLNKNTGSDKNDKPYECLFDASKNINCEQSTGDEGCVSCYRYVPNPDFANVYEYQCTQCADGNIPTLGGKCRQCDQECSTCRQLNDFGQDFTSYLIYKRPVFQADELDGFLNTYNIPPQYVYCFKADPAETFNQLERWSGILFTCLDEGACNCVADTSLVDGVAMVCDECTINEARASDDPFYNVKEDGLKCITCPEYCTACSERLQEEIDEVNSQFLDDSDLGYYSNNCDVCRTVSDPVNEQMTWNSEFSRCVECNAGDQSCRTTYKYDRIIDCQAPLSGYVGGDIPWLRLFDEGLDDGQGTITYNFQEAETIDLLFTYNSQMAEIIEYNIYFYTRGADQVCQIQQNLVLSTIITQFVFAVKQVRLNLNTINNPTSWNDFDPAQIGKYQVKLQFLGNLTFAYFNQIKIQNFQFTFHKDLVVKDVYAFRSENAMEGVGIEFINVLFGPQNVRTGNPITDTDKYIVFQIQNARQLIFRDCKFQGFTYPKALTPFIFPYEMIALDTTFQLYFKNVTFLNNFFLDCQILGLEVRRSSIFVDGLLLQDNVFDAASFMTDVTLPSGEEFPKIYVQVENMRLQNNVMMTSELFRFRELNEFHGYNWTFDGKNIFNSSEEGHVVIRVNTLELERVRFEKYFYTLDATIFGSPTTSNAKHLTQTMVYQIVDLEMDNYVCDQSFACLIYFKTPQMDGNLERIAVRLMNFKIFQTNARLTESNDTLKQFGYENIREMRDENTETTMIVVQKSNLANFINLNFTDNQELRAIFLIDVIDIYISDIICGASYDVPSFIEVDHEISLYLTGVPVDPKELAQIQFEIPQDVSGQHVPQTGACIEVDYVQNVFQLVNFIAENNIFVDTSIINIDNDAYTNPFDTRIILSNVTFKNNIIAITDDTGNDAAFQYQSQALVLIAMDRVTFQDMILQTYANAIVTLPSVSGILIVSFTTDVYMSNMNFKNLTSLNNFNGVFIDVRLLNVSNSVFDGANLELDLNPFLELQNNGGFGHIRYSEYLNFTNVTVQNTWANLGGAFYIYPKSDCEAFFEKCVFENTKTSMAYTSKGFGGVFYVDNENTDNMVVTLRDSQFYNNSARLAGGAIYHFGVRQDSQWNIQRCLFENQTSLMGAVFYGEFFRRDNATIYIQNSTFRGSKIQTMRYFLLLKEGKLLRVPPDLTTVDNVDENAVFYFIAADIQMENNIFEEFYFMCLWNIDLSGIEDKNSIYRNIYFYVDPIMACETSTIDWTNTKFQNIVYNQEGGPISQCIDENNANELSEKLQFAVKIPLCFLWDDRPKTRALMTHFDSPEPLNFTNCVFKQINCTFCSDGLLRIDTVTDGANFIDSIFQENFSHSGAGIFLFKQDPWLLLMLRNLRRRRRNLDQYKQFQLDNPQYAEQINFQENKNRRLDEAVGAPSAAVQEAQQEQKVTFVQKDKYLIKGCTFKQNNASSTLAGATGAGIVFHFQEGTVENNLFQENFSNDVGAGLVVRQTYVSIKNNTFFNNTAKTGASIRFLSFYTEQGTNVRSDIKAIVDTVTAENQFLNNTALFGDDQIIFECVFGEYYSGSNCEDCAPGSYSLIRQDVASASCQDCQEQSSYCPGGYFIEILPGYWRPHPYTDLIDKCVNNLDNCLGGNTTDYQVLMQTGNYLCAQGHTGALCEACDTYGDFWGESYATAGSFSCTRCIQLIATNTLTIFFVTLFTLVIVAVTVRSNLTTNFNLTMVRTQNQFELGIFRVLTLQFFKEDIGALFIKIFTNYTQILGAVATFKIDLPSVINQVSESVGAPVQRVLFSLDCMLAGFSFISIQYMRTVWALIIPIIYGLSLGLGYIAVCRRNHKEPEKHVFISGLIFLYIYYQPNIILQLVNVTSCRQVSDNQYIMSQVDKVCYSQEHVLWLTIFIIPNIIIFGLAIPFVLYQVIQNNQQLLGTTAIRLRYGLLYNQYKESAFFWELLQIVQKLAITFLLNIFNDNDTTQGTTVFLVILIYTIFSLRYNPYQNVNLNRLDFDSSMACGASIILAVLASNNRLTNPQGNAYLFFTAIVVIGLINLYFILIFIQEIVIIQLDSLGPQGQEIQKQIVAQWPFMKRYIKLKITPYELIMARWIVLSKYRRDWAQRKQIDPNAQFWNPSEQLNYKDFQKEVHIKDYYQNTIQRLEEQEKKRLQAEQNQMEENQQLSKGVKVAPLNNQDQLNEDDLQKHQIQVEIHQEEKDQLGDQPQDQNKLKEQKKHDSQGVDDLLQQIANIQKVQVQTLDKVASPERLISPPSEPSNIQQQQLQN